MRPKQIEEQNPIVSILERFGSLDEAGILNCLDRWYFEIDGQKLFDEIKKSGIITQNTLNKHWKLAQKP